VAVATSTAEKVFDAKHEAAQAMKKARY